MKSNVMWWLLAVPVVAYILPLPSVVKFLIFIAVVVVLSVQYRKDKSNKEVLEMLSQLDNDLNNNKLDWEDYYNLKEEAPELWVVVSQKIKDWGVSKLRRNFSFDELVDNPQIDRYFGAIEISDQDDDYNCPEVNEFLDRHQDVFDNGFSQLISNLKSADTLQKVMNAYYRISTLQIYGFNSSLGCLFGNYAREAAEIAMKKIAELPLPESNIDFKCQARDSEDEELNNDYTGAIIVITPTSFVMQSDRSFRISHSKMEIYKPYLEFSQPYKYTTEICFTSDGQIEKYEIEGVDAPLIYALETRFIQQAQLQRQTMIAEVESLKPLQVDDPITFGKNCYFKGELQFSKKVAEDNMGELQVIAPGKDAMVYVLDNNLEFITNDGHVSVSLRDIYQMSINDDNSIMNIVRKGYATPIGFAGDVEPLYRCIKSVQNNIFGKNEG